MTWMIRGAAIVASLAFAGAANAQPSGAETITTTLSFPSFPAAPPFVGAYSGTFVASDPIVDSGAVSAKALFGSVPAPSTGVLETNRTLTSSDGTLTLRCTQIAKQIVNVSQVRDTGSCAVLGATGAYASLSGAGTITGIANLNTGTLTDTLELPVR